MRAELSSTDGLPPPGDLPQGECVMTRLDDGSIRIDRADPRILISGELFDIVMRFGEDGLPGDSFALTARLDVTGCLSPPWRATYVGALLKIAGINQTVIYRITDYLPRIHGYIGEWPD